MLPGATAEGAHAIAGALLGAVARAAEEVVTAGCGVALWSPDGPRDAGALLGEADSAMYRAKEAGRARVAGRDAADAVPVPGTPVSG